MAPPCSDSGWSTRSREAGPVLAATGVGHRYHLRGDWLFRGLDLTVTPGEVISVLGPTARGKTTLLTCLAGIRTRREGCVGITGSLGFIPQSHAAEHPCTVLEMGLLGRATRAREWSGSGSGAG